MTTTDPTVGGIILCGGRGRRIGIDKAWLRFGDEHLLQRMVRVVTDVDPDLRSLHNVNAQAAYERALREL